MKLTVVTISPRLRSKSAPAGMVAADYLDRANRYAPTNSLTFPTEAAFLLSLDKTAAARSRTYVILLDGRGQQLSSEGFAGHLGQLRDAATPQVLLAIGPADGWSADARARADMLLSLGPMTLPHELARVLLAEQVYRALTILAGHPYHSGH